MPASVTDYFGPQNVGPIYGLMLTAWGLASLFGPMLLAGMREATGSYQDALHIIAALMALSIVLPCILRSPQKPPQALRLQGQMKLGAALGSER
jgi:OFA family oxalate/formate antiporter-like MFS transporter